MLKWRLVAPVAKAPTGWPVRNQEFYESIKKRGAEGGNQLKIHLVGISPHLYRRVFVRGDTSLAELHQLMLGFSLQRGEKLR